MLWSKGKAPLVVLLVTMVMLLSACTSSDSDNGDEAEASGDDDGVTLDVETLQAESDAGTFEAEEVPDAFVGEVTEDLFVGVAIYEDDQYSDERGIGVYLCDSGEETNARLSGELDSNGVADLEAELEDGTDVRVTLEIDDDIVTGEVIAADEDAQSFQATLASGDAGLYVAEETFADEEHRGTWIVLEDGRQRGVTCPPFPIIVCLPTGPGTSTF